MTISAVLFDQGNTLLEYSYQGRWREFRLRRLAELHPLVCDLTGPVELSPQDFAARIAEVMSRGSQDIDQGEQSWHFRDRLRAGLAAVGLRADDDALERLTDAYYEPIRACTRPYPETREALDRLRALGVPMVIITNAPWDTPARLVRGDLERWGMAGYFDAFICSGELPWRKPNPRFMLAAAKALGMAVEECLVVGDTLEVDIAGAQAAGMRSVWVNRDGADRPAEAPEPTWMVRELTEVAEIVRQERTGT
jgi:HAD superfamily hydrolase (TIGR01549 family)